ncbi:MAG: sulfotransferase [Pseudomonadota bacterium]
MRRLFQALAKRGHSAPVDELERSNKKGPDFICIGMQKAATRTLYDLLSFEEGFWMPLVKEFHHFDKGYIPRRHQEQYRYLQALESGGKPHRRQNARRAKYNKRPLDSIDLEFLNASKAYLAGGMTDALYLDLFSMCPKGHWVGDITPGYSNLDLEAAKGAHALLPNAKIVFIVRDPVARAWSNINMAITKRLQIDKANFDEAAAKRISDYIHNENFVDTYVNKDLRRGFPTRIYQIWIEACGAENVLVYSFEDVTRRPKGSILALRRFLTGEATETMPKIEEDDEGGARKAPNRKANAPRVEMTDVYREKLVEMFREELVVAQAVFGDKAAGWAEKYGISTSG